MKGCQHETNGSQVVCTKKWAPLYNMVPQTVLSRSFPFWLELIARPRGGVIKIEVGGGGQKPKASAHRWWWKAEGLPPML